jgi:O-antigen biosynthesis protein
MQILRERGLRGLGGAIARYALRQVRGGDGDRVPARSYSEWLKQKTPGEQELARQSALARTLGWQPEIDVLILRRPGDASAHAETIESLRRQSYSRHRAFSAEGTSIADAWNAAAAKGRGELLLFLESGDVLAPQGLFAMASCGDPAAGLYYTDEDLLLGDAGSDRPRFKPEWSPEALFSGDWVGGPKFIRRHLFERAKGFRPAEGAEQLDLLLRLPAELKARRIPEVLLHRRAGASELSPNALRRVLRAYVQRNPGLDWSVAGSGEPRIRYAPAEPARVSVIIPIRDKVELLRNCIASIDAHPCQASLEIIVVDNGSVEPATREYLAMLQSRAATQVIADSRPFNWSAINNGAARRASGTYLLFLNNDIEVLEDGWVDAMLAFASRSEIGMVGAQLLYPDGTLQHYGVVLGLTGFAGHLLTGTSPNEPSVLGSARSIRNCTAVTGACMLVRRELFERLGGFDESFQVCGSDVEICLRALRAGLRNVVTPHARLTHFESKTRGPEVPKNDYQRSFLAYEPWLRNGDAYYSPHLSLKSVEPELRFEPEDMLAFARSFT